MQTLQRAGLLLASLALTGLASAQSSPADAFTRVRYETRSPLRGGEITRTVTVYADGRVVASVQRGRQTRRFTGRATEAELDELEAAVLGAGLRTVRDPQREPLRGYVPPRVVARDSFVLSVQSPDSQLEGATRGKLSFYGRRDPRLHPLLDLLACIARRVSTPEVVETTISGGIEVDGAWGFRSLHLVAGGEDTRIEPWTTARTLIGLEGETCRVRGVLVGDTLRGATILSPVRRDLRGVVMRVGGAPKLRVDGGELDVPGQPPTAERRLADLAGPAAPVLAALGEARVSLDGWVFSDETGRITKLHVLSVSAFAGPGARLGTSNALPARLSPGQSMELLELTPSGRSFKVRLADGRQGAVSLQEVRLEAPRAGGLAGSPAFGP